MLYANQTIHSGSFPNLMQALAAYGVHSETLEIAAEYLNLENPRNDSLLDQIQKQDFSGYYNVYSQNTKNRENAIKKEINRHNSDELEERFFLLIYTIGGLSCTVLGLNDVGSDYNKRKEKILKAFRSRFGDEADAIYLAIYSDRNSNHIIQSYGMEITEAAPEVCLKAIAYLSNYNAKLKLVISAMNELVPPEQMTMLDAVKTIFSGKKAEYRPSLLIPQAVKIMDEIIIPGSVSLPEKNAYLLSLALASGYDEKYFVLFKSEIANKQGTFTEWILKSNIDKNRVLDVVERAEVPTPQYISHIAHADADDRRYWRGSLRYRDSRLENIAKKYPEVFRQQMNQEEDITIASRMEKILKSVDKSYQGGTDVQDKARRQCIDILTSENPNEKVQIESFLTGSMSMEDFLPVASNLKPSKGSYYGSVHYVTVYGLDEFAERCICYRTMLDYDHYYYPLTALPGYPLEDHEEKVIEILRKYHVPMTYILNGVVKMAEQHYQKDIRKKVIRKLSDFADEIAALDVKSLNVEARYARIEILASHNKYQHIERILEAAQDSSKKVRQLVAESLPAPGKELNQKYLDLLTGKKISQREIAVSLLEKNFPDCYQDAVQKAFEAEKNEALKARLAALLNQEVSAVPAVEINLVDEYSKGNKAKKVAWLFQNPFTPVHDKSGNEVEEKYLIAITNCYASMDICKFTRSEIADKIAENLNQTDVERFAQEVFSRFIDRGAEAKQKWVIYFTGIMGGSEAVASLQHYIKEWSENSRGAIASEAVKALAFSGSSSALMAVDGMARKFKNKQVRNAANAALVQAAEALHITREELADRIVPDLGFDENLCRIFDYGQRQFKVYLTPALELEIFEDEKKLKNLPKPGKNDDPEKSEQASRDFKEMKKQMKTAVQSQKARLEYVLLCDRKWSPDAWKELFIKKPVMHCFAIGLIWGAYDEQDQLLQTFRYMEDGSFNTSDEDEYELPEQCRIGLVHPVELDKDLIQTWTEQLSDYEISQPFPQLNRPVYTVLPEEIGKKALQRFSGTELTNLSLINKMTKFGWEKGAAQDAGCFYEFVRNDIARQEKIGDKIQNIGYYAELQFSGSYIAAGYMDAEDVTIEALKIWKQSSAMFKDEDALNLEEVSPRYFSEIVAQLSEMLPKEENNA